MVVRCELLYVGHCLQTTRARRRNQQEEARKRTKAALHSATWMLFAILVKLRDPAAIGLVLPAVL